MIPLCGWPQPKPLMPRIRTPAGSILFYQKNYHRDNWLVAAKRS